MLDTNICSELSRKNETVISHFQKRQIKEMLLGNDDVVFCISSIVLSELEFGVVKNPKYKNAVSEFLLVVNVLDYDSLAADHYGDIRQLLTSQGNIIGPNDLFIAAHARSLEATLITNNMKEFERVPDLMLDNWID